MIRKSDWQPRLLEYVSQPRKFSWPDGNCAAFVAGGVDYICDGTNYLDRLTRQFAASCNSEKETVDTVESGGGLEVLVDKFLGARFKIPWGQARAGDVILVRDGNDLEVLGLCIGAQVICATARGVVPIRLARAIAAWRIG